MRRVDFVDIEALGKSFVAGEGDKKFCRCGQSNSFPYCDGTHVELNKQGVTNFGPVVVKAPQKPESLTPWGTPMPVIIEAAKSGNGTLEKVGIRVNDSIQCPGCNQRFASQEIQGLHWKFLHDFPQEWCPPCEAPETR